MRERGVLFTAIVWDRLIGKLYIFADLPGEKGRRTIIVWGVGGDPGRGCLRS